MIPTAVEDTRSLLARHLADRLASECDLPHAELLEAASSAALYIETSRFGSALPDDFLDLLVARLLWTLQCTKEAEALLKRAYPEGYPLYRQCMRSKGSLEECWAVLHSGVLAYEQWLSLDCAPCWTLDLSHLSDLSGVFTELSLYQSLQRLVRLLSGGWAGEPEFVLGIKGLNRSEYQAHAAEILAFCRQALAEHLEGATIPGVYALDIAAA